MFPGTDPVDTMSIHQVDDIFDVVLAYEGALRSLGLQGAPVIGASFGGMLAAELAAELPRSVRSVDPPRSRRPVVGVGAMDLELHERATGKHSRAAVQEPRRARGAARCSHPPSPERALDVAVNTIWALGCVAKFLWPLPDRGLSKRLHRVSAPTLVIWGEDDALIPVHYAHEYGRLIPHSRVEVIPDCGHVPQVEKPDATAALVKEFLERMIVEVDEPVRLRPRIRAGPARAVPAAPH